MLIDTNILLDVLLKRYPHFENSLKIWRLCEDKLADGYVSAISIPNIIYILRKELSPEMTAKVYGTLSFLFRITELNASDLAQAARMQWKDYEDAVQSATAERLRCDAIITRNVRDYQGSRVPALFPEAFL